MMRNVSLEDGEGNEAIVGRHGLLTMRIAMVLTALRKWEAGWNMKDVTCSDEDFSITIELVKVLAGTQPLPLHHPARNGTETLADDLFPPRAGVLQEAARELHLHGISHRDGAMDISRSTAKRWLKKMLKQNLVAYDNGIYRKVHSTE